MRADAGQQKISDAALLGDIRRVYRRHGAKGLRMTTYQRAGRFSSFLVHVRFGGWPAALAAAGLAKAYRRSGGWGTSETASARRHRQNRGTSQKAEWQTQEVALREARELRTRRASYAGPTTCLRCGGRFASWDRRYNRRCPPCEKSVQLLCPVEDDGYRARSRKGYLGA